MLSDEITPSSSKRDYQMTEDKGINIEHHDHDYHPHGYGYGYGGGAGGMAVGWGILAFIAFIVVVWAVWTNHNRCSDQHVDHMRAVDRTGYEVGYMQKQLNDMQKTEDYILASQVKWHDDELRFGQPYGNHTQAPGGPRRQYGYGSVINGSPINESHNFASENSAFG